MCGDFMDNNFLSRNTEYSKKKSKKNQNNLMTKITVVQLVLSFIIVLVLFGICRLETNLSDNIKQIYDDISKNDIAISTIIDVFKNVTKETFSPNVEDSVGETKNDVTGESENISPVFLTFKMQNPLESKNITSLYGYRISPITNKNSFHRGLDIAAPKSTEIYASYNGVVEIADYNDINGNYLVIKHSDSVKTTYNHCDKLLVKQGYRVNKGECIALVGETGYATGNHLHFEVIVNNSFVNPIWVLNYEV